MLIYVYTLCMRSVTTTCSGRPGKAERREEIDMDDAARKLQTPAVQMRDVVKSYDVAASKFTALDRVNLEIAPGEFVAVIGKSGSGKSTLINMIAGIDRPTSGEIRVAGTQLNELSESTLAGWRGRNVGVVFQFFQLLPTLTIAENVVLPMDLGATFPARERLPRALALLHRVGITDQADKLPANLSGGQQQRAAIARALANGPPILLADEPTGNLDSHTAGQILELFADLASSGTTIVIVTHEREIAAAVDRIVALSDGRVESNKQVGVSP